MSLYQRVLGIPFVYNKVRPLVLGGIDMSPVYERLEVQPGDTVLDVGCGTGVALECLPQFARYVGFDTDEVALRYARQRVRGESRNVQFEGRILQAKDVEEWAPDVAVLAGLLHHLTDDECRALFRDLKRSTKLRRVTTLDVSFFPGQYLNNFFTRMDRGKFPRHPEVYSELARQGGYRVEEGIKIPSRPGGKRISYWVMRLAPER